MAVGIPRTIQILILVTLVGAFLAIGAGCSDPGFGTGPENPPPVTDELPYPSDPDVLMHNFERIYEDMLVDDFKDMMHPAYRMVLLPATVAMWQEADEPLVAGHFTRDHEIGIHRNIFSGNTGQDANASPVPPVSSITFEVFQKDSTWEPIAETDPDFAGQAGYWTTFNVILHLDCPDSYRMEIRDVLEIYVAPVDDSNREKWLLLGIREVGFLDKGTERISFGHVKAMFR